MSGSRALSPHGSVRVMTELGHSCSALGVSPGLLVVFVAHFQTGKKVVITDRGGERLAWAPPLEPVLGRAFGLASHAMASGVALFWR